MLAGDLRLTLRALAARRGLSIVRATTLAGVTGAASAVFVLANGLFLEALPFQDSSRLVRIYMQPPGTASFDEANPLHSLEFLRFRSQLASLAAIEGVWAQERAIGGEDPESVPAASVSAGLFGLLGAAPAIGRTFNEAEAHDDRKVVVLSDGLWKRRFGARPDVIGQTITIDRVQHEIVGVMGPDFEPVYVRSELWTPLIVREGRLILPSATFIQTVGRLRPGVEIAAVQRELDAGLAQLVPDSPATLTGWGVGVRDLRAAQFGGQTRAAVLLIASVLVLVLVAAANLANLTLADVLARRGELALRAALGASRGALVWPEVLCSLLLAVVGSAAGLAIAGWLVPVLVALDPSGPLERLHLTLDWRVAGATIALATVVMAMAAAVPTLRVARRDVSTALAEGGHRTTGGGTHERVRAWLVAAQSALALILATTSVLVTAALDRTSKIDPGFDPTSVLTAQLRLPETVYTTEAHRAAFVADVLTRVRAIPGVVDASTTMNLFVPGHTYQTLVFIEGRPTPSGEPQTVLFRRVSDGYFRTMRIPELSGRTFDSRDRAGGLPTAIVSRAFAQRFWPGEGAVGRRVKRPGASSPWLTIVGVVGDVHDLGYGHAALPAIYLPYAQNNSAASPVSLVVRTAGDPTSFAGAVRAAVCAVDPAQPLSRVSTLEIFLADSLGPQRLRSILLGVFGSLGLLLATVGIFAVTARTVVERTREVGVRLALGGHPTRIWWEVARRAIQPFLAGVGAGTAAAAAVAALLAGVFPEVHATPRAFMLPAIAVLVLAGTGTAIAAARRATSVDPLIALRSQ